MEKQKFLEATLNKLRSAAEFLRDGINAVNELLGAYEASDDVASWKRSQFQLWTNTAATMHAAEAEKQVNDEGISWVNTKKEIEEMLITLNIRGSVRLRKDGLYELRTKFGSVYGRTVNELQGKLEKKITKTGKKAATFKRTAPQIQKQTSKSPLFSEFFENNYLPYKRGQVKERTIQRMIYNFNYIKACTFDMPLNKYTPKLVTDFLLSIPETRKRQIMQGLLNNVFKFAVQLDILDRSPTANIEPMKHVEKIGKAFPFHEQREFFKNLFADDEIPYVRKCYLLLVYLTGTRRGEALYLQADDVQDVLHVRGTKTEGSNRYMPLTPLVKKLLHSIVPCANGRYFPFSEYVVEKIFHKYGGSHKLHDLRHTYGTIMVCAEQLDAKTVSLFMGHSTVEMTLERYTHPEQLDRVLFFDGSLTAQEKAERLKAQYADILRDIEDFLN